MKQNISVVNQISNFEYVRYKGKCYPKGVEGRAWGWGWGGHNQCGMLLVERKSFIVTMTKA